MRWRPLSEFPEQTVPKLANLRRAKDAGLRVPEPTFWAAAAELDRAGPATVPSGLDVPLFVRSASPTEDTENSSQAGQFLSLCVVTASAFPEAVMRVVQSLPTYGGVRQGTVFVQPRVRAERAGITFFDGFYYEETSTAGENLSLTNGDRRGTVRRGHLQRGEALSRWLVAIHRVFGGRLDLEWTEGFDGTRTLLQVRPALFPVRRNETLSLANHKEILGDPPSPWIVDLFVSVGRTVLEDFAAVDPIVLEWDEPYAVELAERAWMNFSAFFRLMDHWGLPRTMVTEGVGGDIHGPEDQRYDLLRLAYKVPTLVRLAFKHFRFMASLQRRLRVLDEHLDRARGLVELHTVNAEGLDLSFRMNIAILQVLAVMSKVRRRLGFTQAARVVTHEMMASYAQYASRPDPAERLAGLEGWLVKYGHRGPLETDPWHPRFAELRDRLRADLLRGPAPATAERPQPSLLRSALGRPFFIPDEFRERFRDLLMHRWQRLRIRILEEARRATASGYLEEADDVFFLRREDLEAAPTTWAARVARRRRLWERAKLLCLPTTSSRDEIAAALGSRSHTAGSGAEAGTFTGIGLGTEVVAGSAVKGRALDDFLAGRSLPDSPVLIAETLEPSWAVLFPRFAAVVADLGGELSHAAILLREAGITAVVNARGAYAGITDGDRVRVDPVHGEVLIEAPPNAIPTIQAKPKLVEASS
jgi:phosphohistidine swiveling domain-containing protein